MPRDLLAETLWINGRAVTVTPELLSEALTFIEEHVGVGRAVEQADIADAVVQILHARQVAETQGGLPTSPQLSIRHRGIAETTSFVVESTSDPS
jgi:hypothetical protein